jgi:hypothetical protein
MIMMAAPKTFLHRFVAFWVSLKLTIVCLALGMVLIVVGTLAQKHMAIDEALERYFRTVFVWGAPLAPFGIETEVPIFPGGFLVGTVLLLNLIAAHLYRFQFSWKKTGIVMVHGGLILLLLGELFTAMFQKESFLRFDEGQSQDYSISRSENELAIIDHSDPQKDKVAAIADFALEPGAQIQDLALPFRVRVSEYLRFSRLVPRRNAPAGYQAPAASVGVGLNSVAVPVARPKTNEEMAESAAWVELSGASGSLGTWLVSTELGQPQTFTHDGKTYSVELRPRRFRKEFSLTLLDFRFDRYAGTQVARNYSSLVRLVDPRTNVNREVLIYMNHPLRHDGFTFYQHSFEQGETTSILQVVQNPSWLLPYISCVLVGAGLVVQFGMHLRVFNRRRRAEGAGTTTLSSAADANATQRELLSTR